MFNKFINGLVFGSGFAIAFTIISYLGLSLLTNVKFNKQTYSAPSNSEKTISSSPQKLITPSTPFHELSVEDKIKASSVIALMRYEKSPDGKVKTIIKEFLKKDKDVTIYYNVGDEYKSPGYYPKSEKIYDDGVIVFFQGSPATMRFSTTYYGDRIAGLSDLPVELLRKKCK